jgi:RNA polymerase sigma-70 factor, ECF subfamily
MPQPPATAPDLVRGLRAGRRDAFERLYSEYHAPIYNLCARVLGDREEAKDVTQDVFIKAFDQLPATDAESFGLRPWLYRVAANACFNRLRSRRHLDDGGDTGLAQAASGVDEFERAQIVALVEQSLGEMNERYRTALVLKDLQGLPPEEIAEVMEVSRANADVLVHRARASFKTVFARLAGADAAAPAALGLVLLPLSVPAALQAMPPLPAHVAPLHAPVHPGIPASAGPAGAGLLTKIGAALTTKAAITAAATALVVGGAVVAVKEAERHHRPAPAAAAAASTRTGAPAHYASLGTRPPHVARWARHGVPLGTCADTSCGDAASGEHHSGDHHAGGHAGEHPDSSSHDSAAHAADDGGASASAPMTTHDGSTSTSHTSDHSTSTTTTHDGGDTPNGGDGGSHD